MHKKKKVKEDEVEMMIFEVHVHGWTGLCVVRCAFVFTTELFWRKGMEAEVVELPWVASGL